jgi:hypothetical protein
LVVPASRVSLLRAAGWALVASDRLEPADVIVISVDAGTAGVLEAADLARLGIARRVAVFNNFVTGADRELSRRGVTYQDSATVSIEQLRALGIPAQAIAPAVSGSEDEGPALARWCTEQHVRRLVFISKSDHSRRTRRILRRALEPLDVEIIEQPSRYSSFEPDAWWRTRDGVRTELTESQKLAWDLLRHPFS